MEFSREDKDGITIMRLRGEVDMRSSPELRKALSQVTDESVPHVVISLEEVSYIDSSGIATLIECLKHVAQYGGKLTLIGVNEDIYPVFELAQLHQVFDLRRDTTMD